MIQGDTVYLRALEPEDLDFLYKAENDANLWHAGVLQQPISKFTLKAYLTNAHQSIQEAGQMRLVICLTDKTPIGLIDLFDFDAQHQRAAVGILLLQQHRGKGLAAHALRLLLKYCTTVLGIHQLHCYVQASNMPSLGLFKRSGFVVAGELKDWLRTKTGFENVYFLQCVL